MSHLCVATFCFSFMRSYFSSRLISAFDVMSCLHLNSWSAVPDCLGPHPINVMKPQSVFSCGPSAVHFEVEALNKGAAGRNLFSNAVRNLDCLFLFPAEPLTFSRR